MKLTEDSRRQTVRMMLNLLQRQQTISVCLPTKNEQATIGAALAPLSHMLQDGLVDQLVVCDQSEDWTADIAASFDGVEVHKAEHLCPELGPVLGKGDNLYRSLRVLSGDVILWLDADTTNIARHFVFAMVAPILAGEADYVKGHYRRPLGTDPDGGGRLNHLFARPLMAAYFPELAWIEQPLAGETALTKELAMRLPFETGWAIEPCLTIDAFLLHARIVQADLGIHEHRHWPIRELAERCPEVLFAIRDKAMPADPELRYPLADHPQRPPHANRAVPIPS